nr:NADP-dependent isocitrate dehydrogenase [Tessaracoccus sp.]
MHLKATMMKVSDPVLFGHVIKAFFPEVFAAYGDDLAAAGLSANDGLGAILAGLDALDNGAEIRAAFEKASPMALRSRWSARTGASPTCTSRLTSSSTPRCPP